MVNDPFPLPVAAPDHAREGIEWLRKLADTGREYPPELVHGVWHDGPVRQDALAALDVLLAVGERKAEREAERAVWLESALNELHEAQVQRERDRRQIAQLTEALDARPITREHAFRAAQNAVRNQGYAVALHGSQIKDLDLIAVPWQETALTAQDVAELIAAAIPGFIEKGSPEAMPNGRLSFTIRPNWHYGFDHWWIDLAVMPRECDCPVRAVLAGEEDAANGRAAR